MSHETYALISNIVSVRRLLDTPMKCLSCEVLLHEVKACMLQMVYR